MAAMDRTALLIVRIATAVVLEIHGAFRGLTLGANGFGEYLNSQGFPAAHVLAWAITCFEIVAPPLWALGVLVRWLTPVHMAILGTGIVMVHAPEGWFVVGGGRNGAEYSVLIIMNLVAIWVAGGARRGRVA
jgi:putative oxidoreductase